MLSIAVCIPTIPGREEMLARAVASVEAQERRPDQVIIETDENRTGAASTRNRALAKVKTDLVAWLDDDDEFLPNHLERLARFLERYDQFGLVYPIPQVVGGRDPTATSVNGYWVPPWRVPFGSEQEEHLRAYGSFIPVAHMVRSRSVNAIGGFPQPGDVRWIEDWGYLVKLLDIGVKFYHLPVTTWRWNIHGAQTGGGIHEPGKPLWDRR